MEQSDLVNNIIRGDAASFEILFKDYCQRLINFSRRYVLDKQIAENIVQDVFLNIWQNRSKLNPGLSINSYLFTSVKNESFKYLRHLKVELNSEEKIKIYMPDEISPEKYVDQNEIEKEIYKSINELPEKCREIFNMNRFDRLKYSEIADILGISIKTVETQMGRALKKLREQLAHFLSMFILQIILKHFLE